MADSAAASRFSCAIRCMMPERSPPAVQPLKRSLGVAGVLFLTLSVTTPASSLFVIVPGMLQVAGTGAVWATLLAALVCLMTALIYAELSSAWPVAGGEYVAVAQTLGPGAGFVMLGVNAFSNMLFPPVAALGIAAILSGVLPGLPEVPVAIAVLAGATLVAVLDIRTNALVTGAFLVVELVAIGVVVALGFAHPVLGFGAMLVHPVMPAGDALVPASAGAIGVAASIALFAFNGYGMAVYFAEEMHDAARRVGPTVMIAVAVTIVSIALPVVALLGGAPDLATVLRADDPFGMLVTTLGGKALGQAVALGIVVSIVNAIIASILACARFFYSSARDRCWGNPFDRWLAAIHPRFGSPWVGTLLIGGFMVTACSVPLRLLLVVSGAGLVAIYGGMALAAIAGRRSGQLRDAPYRMPLYPLAPLLTLGALGYIAVTSWLDPGEGRTGVVVTGVQMLASLAYYRLVLKPRGWKVCAQTNE